jgi:hypothetical protein
LWLQPVRTVDTSLNESLELWVQAGSVRIAGIANGSIGGKASSLIIRAPRVLARVGEQSQTQHGTEVST